MPALLNNSKMKYSNAIKMIVLVILLLNLSYCGSSEAEELTPNQKAEALLISRSWSLTSVSIDGVDSNLYSGLTLTFKPGNFSSAKSNKVWPASGTWNFAGEAGNKIVRNDGVEITIESLSTTQFIITFTWSSTTFESGRGNSLKGNHRMTFN